MMTFKIVKRPIGVSDDGGVWCRNIQARSLKEAEALAEQLDASWQNGSYVYGLRIYGPDVYQGPVSSFCRFHGEWLHAPEWDE